MKTKRLLILVVVLPLAVIVACGARSHEGQTQPASLSLRNCRLSINDSPEYTTRPISVVFALSVLVAGS